MLTSWLVKQWPSLVTLVIGVVLGWWLFGRSEPRVVTKVETVYVDKVVVEYRDRVVEVKTVTERVIKSKEGTVTTEKVVEEATSQEKAASVARTEIKEHSVVAFVAKPRYRLGVVANVLDKTDDIYSRFSAFMAIRVGNSPVSVFATVQPVGWRVNVGLDMEF